MRLAIVAIGRLKDGGERDLFDRYTTRVAQAGRSVSLGPIVLNELPESRLATVDARKADEAARLIKAAGGAAIVTLDEHGTTMTSAAFAARLAGWRDGGQTSLAFLIGGHDGHGAAALEGAALRLSLGAMTLPHGLARVVLAEQVYRAITILAGHPYHRA